MKTHETSSNEPFSTTSSVSSNSQNVSFGSQKYDQSVMNKLEKMSVIQEQHSLFLDEIIRTLRVQNVQQLVKPSQCPDFPLKNVEELENFEGFLSNELNFEYMVKIIDFTVVIFF